MLHHPDEILKTNLTVGNTSKYNYQVVHTGDHTRESKNRFSGRGLDLLRRSDSLPGDISFMRLFKETFTTGNSTPLTKNVRYGMN